MTGVLALRKFIYEEINQQRLLNARRSWVNIARYLIL